MTSRDADREPKFEIHCNGDVPKAVVDVMRREYAKMTKRDEDTKRREREALHRFPRVGSFSNVPVIFMFGAEYEAEYLRTLYAPVIEAARAVVDGFIDEEKFERVPGGGLLKRCMECGNVIDTDLGCDMVCGIGILRRALADLDKGAGNGG